MKSSKPKLTGFFPGILKALLTLLLWNQNRNQNLATYSLRACGINRRLFYHVGKFAAGSRQTLIKSLDLLGYYLNGSKHHPKVSKGILSPWIIQSFSLWHQMIQRIERNKRKLTEQRRKLNPNMDEIDDGENRHLQLLPLKITIDKIWDSFF